VVDATFALGLRIEERHCNGRGVAHGGLLVTLADLILGYACVREASGLSFVTVGLTTDFAGSAAVGDWVEGAQTCRKSVATWLSPVAISAWVTAASFAQAEPSQSAASPIRRRLAEYPFRTGPFDGNSPDPNGVAAACSGFRIGRQSGPVDLFGLFAGSFFLVALFLIFLGLLGPVAIGTLHVVVWLGGHST
jgi:hypothetical protein